MNNLVAVFIENKAGKLAKVTDILAKNNIDILFVDIADNTQFGVLRLLVDNPEKARDVLYNENFTVALEKVVIAEIENKVGSFANLCKILEKENVNIKEAGGCVMGTEAVFIIRAENPENIEKILNKWGVKIY